MKLPHLVSWMDVEHVSNRKHHTWWDIWVGISVHLWGIGISTIIPGDLVDSKSILFGVICLSAQERFRVNALYILEKVLVVLKGMEKGLIEDDVDNNTPGVL